MTRGPDARYDPSAIAFPRPPAHIHFVGIGGVGVSGLARMALKMGYRVTGSDASPSPTTVELENLGIPVAIGHVAGRVEGADFVVATAAARDDNPELAAARSAGTPVVKRAALLGLLANPRRCLAVAGTHGKSTTSGMATVALEHAGLDPSFAVGATVREFGTNARLDSGDIFVVEADEYDYSFLWLRPSVAIITNIEHDHPDIFPDLDAVLDAFERFAGGVARDGTLVLAADDPGCIALQTRLGATFASRIVTFGESAGDWRIVPDPSDGWLVHGPYGRVFALRLRVPGRHNVHNALAVLAAAGGLGVDPARLVAGLEAFGGVGRRFEVHADSPMLTVVDDYAHHPTEVAATIAAARERFPGRRLLVVFQPHTYSRTRALRDEFAAALDAADEVVLAAIYASRETDSLGVSSADVAERMRAPVRLAGDPRHAAGVAATLRRDGDVVLVMGAGDIYLASRMLASGEPR